MLPGNSVLKVTSWKYKNIFTEKLSLYEQTEFLMVKGIISAFDYTCIRNFVCSYI